jgi:hypothetical protein
MIDNHETLAERRAREVQGIFDRTSAMVWDALPPEARRSHLGANDVSVPDYAQDHASHTSDSYEDTTTSRRGPEYWTEKRASDIEQTARGADAFGERCREERIGRAKRKCERHTLPDGRINLSLTPEQCMRFWAEGTPDETWTTSTVSERMNGSSHELGLEGGLSAGGDGPVNGKATGAVKRVGAESTTTAEKLERTQTKRGSEGYLRECAQEEKEWFDARMKAAEPYSE